MEIKSDRDPETYIQLSLQWHINYIFLLHEREMNGTWNLCLVYPPTPHTPAARRKSKIPFLPSQDVISNDQTMTYLHDLGVFKVFNFSSLDWLDTFDRGSLECMLKICYKVRNGNFLM